MVSKIKRKSQIGIGLGIVVIMTRLMAAPTIAASPEAVLSYGLITGLIFSITLFLGIFLFGFMGRRIRNQSLDCHTIADFFKQNLQPLDYKIFIALILLLSVQGILLQVIVIKNLLSFNFGPSLQLLLISTYFLFIFAVATRGISAVNRLAQWQISLFFAVATLVPVYSLIQQGLKPVYNGILLYHPYLLVMVRDGSFFFIAISILIGCGYIFLNPALWQRLFQLNAAKVRQTFFLSSFFWCVIPISILCIFFLLIYQGSFNTYANIALQVIQTATPILLFLMFLGISTTLTAALGSELQAVITLVKKNIFTEYHLTKRRKLYFGLLLSGIVISITSFIFIYYQPTFLDVFYIGGIIQVSLLPQIIMLIFQHHRLKVNVAAAPILGIVSGYIIYLNTHHLAGIASAFIISSMITLGFKILNNIKNRPDRKFNMN